MRIAAPLILVLLLGAPALAGCGGRSGPAAATTARRAAPAPVGLRVGVVGRLEVDVRGSVTVRGPLASVADLPLVVVAGAPRGVEAAAEAHPSTHFALVGRSWRTVDRPNVAGLLFRESDAAYLAGIVAGLAIEDGGVADARAAWVGPRADDVVTAFDAGARSIVAGLVILHRYPTQSLTHCKEAALGAIRRQAAVIVGAHGACATGALRAAREQNVVGLSLGDFELPDTLAARAVADAVTGRYNGGEDVVFDASSGAIGIGRLDPHLSSEAAGLARAAAQDLAAGLRVPR